MYLEMTAWLDRAEGYHLYCHSLACLLSNLACSLGIDAPYVTLGVGFTTHLARPACTEEWDTYGFNSHGIAEAAEVGLVWDAAVDFDGDASPSSLPVEAVAPMGITLEEYLALLSGDPVDQVNGGYCYMY